MKHLKHIQFHKKYIKLVYCILVIQLAFIFMVTGCSYESYKEKVLVENDVFDSEFCNLDELYHIIVEKYCSYIEEHELVQIDGSFSSNTEEDFGYKQIVFHFSRYLDDKAEGGRSSIISVAVDLDSSALSIKEYVGSDKASSISGMTLLTEKDDLYSIEKELLSSTQNNQIMHFEVWRTIKLDNDNVYPGNIKVRIYCPAE